MKHLTLALTVVAATCLLNGSQTRAEFPVLRLFRDRPAVQSPSPSGDRQSQWDRQRPYDSTWFQPEMYPKYYAGFHYRNFEIYDSPSGQRGLRGTAW